MPQITRENPILLISGTNRPGSNALRVAQVVEDHYRAMGVPCELFSLMNLPPALFTPEAYATKPPEFVRLQQRVLDAAGLHLVVPEYNGGYPGVLKVFIDHLKVPDSFEFKPFCLTSESTGQFGALRAVEQLTTVLSYRNGHLFPRRVFISKVGEAFDDAGAVKDTNLNQRLARQARDFAEFATLC